MIMIIYILFLKRKKDVYVYMKDNKMIRKKSAKGYAWNERMLWKLK